MMEWFRFLQRIRSALGERPASVCEAGEVEVTESSLPLRAVDVARNEIGCGEDGGNNRGVHIEEYRAGDETGGKIRTSESWCASFVSYCYARACLHESGLPFKTSRGAKRLTKNIGKVGKFLDTPIPGAVICWHRGHNERTRWQGHVGIIESYEPLEDMVVTIEGNRGPYPSYVSRYFYPAGKWRRRLYRIAIP